MLGRLGACRGGGFSRRVIHGDSLSVSETPIAPASSVTPVDGVLLQSSGDVGGMLVAGVLLVLVGLVTVAIVTGYASSLTSSLFDGDRVATGKSGAPTSPPETEEAPAEAGQVETGESEAVELTDRELIVDILEDNDGRMKQARIVDATGWSKSKVSMLLSEMEDDDEVTKLRVGRENIVSLSGNEPDAAGSPFDGE